MHFKQALKKIFIFSIITSIIFFNNNVFADKYDQISLNGSSFESDVAKNKIANTGGLSTAVTVPEIIGNVIKIILGISGTVALIFIIWGGIKWMTSQGKPDAIREARKLMTSGMIGIAIIAAAYAITDFVIRQITSIAG